MRPNKIFDQLVAALCNTLLHSLWQGILLAAIDGPIVIGTRRASNETATTDLNPQPAAAPGFVARVRAYLQDHRNTIVMVWFLIICARSLQFNAIDRVTPSA